MQECEELRQGISQQAWLAHKQLVELQCKIFDRRLSHLLMMQQVAPEKNGLSQLDGKGLSDKLMAAQEDLDKLMKKYKSEKSVK